MEPQEFAIWCGLIIAASGAITVILKFVKSIFKAYKCTRDGLTHIQEVHDVVVRELMPNGGGSLVDRVQRIDQRVADLETWQQISKDSS